MSFLPGLGAVQKEVLYNLSVQDENCIAPKIDKTRRKGSLSKLRKTVLKKIIIERVVFHFFGIINTLVTRQNYVYEL